jgi:hypothetical protein
MPAAISLSGSTPENRLPAAASDLQGLENVGALVDLDAHDLAARCGVVAARMGVERFAGDSPNRHAARRDFRQVVVSDLKRAFGQRGARGIVGKGPKRHRVQLALGFALGGEGDAAVQRYGLPTHGIEADGGVAETYVRLGTEGGGQRRDASEQP